MSPFLKVSSVNAVDINRARCLNNPGYRPFQTGALSNVVGMPNCFGEVSAALYGVGDDSFQTNGDDYRCVIHDEDTSILYTDHNNIMM